MARTEIETVIIEAIRAKLPKGYTLRGGSRQSFYKAGIYTNNKLVAQILIRTTGIITLKRIGGIKVNKKVPHPPRELKVNIVEPTSIESLEKWATTLTGIVPPCVSPRKP